MARNPDITGDAQKSLREAISRGGTMPLTPPDLVGGPMQKPGNPVGIVEQPVSKLNPAFLRRLLRRG